MESNSAEATVAQDPSQPKMTHTGEKQASVMMEVESSPDKTISTSDSTFAVEINTTGESSVDKTPVNNDKVATDGYTDDTQHSKQTPKIKMSMSEGPTPSKSKTSPKPANKSVTKGKTYITMIHGIIAELGDRTGSSIPAIMKVMKVKYPHIVQKPTFKNAFNLAIKTGVKDKRLIKIRASYKVSSEWVKKEKAKVRAKELKKKMGEKKRRNEMAKRKEEKAKQQQKDVKKENVSPNLIETVTSEKERIAQKEAEKKREKAAAKAKEIADRIKKRRFPMDDHELIEEDRELRVKRPANVARQPFLPYAIMSTVPIEDRPSGKKTTPTSAVNACTKILSGQSRNLVSDLLQIFSFFSGDVGFSRMFPLLAPKFTLKHLFYALNEVVIGNTKHSRVVPPLLIQLFLSSLRILTDPSEFSPLEEEVVDPKLQKLHNDLSKLKPCLDETSWSECLFCYIDLMERYYTSEATSTGSDLLGFPVTIVDDKSDESSVPNGEEFESNTDKIADGYTGYLGPLNGNIRNAYQKLMHQDPWYLNADELLALLRALTDDILAVNNELAKEFVNRDEELNELFKAKKSTEYNFRKARVAYEGPKKKKKVPGANSIESKKSEKDDDLKNKNEEENKFKPTISKGDFEAAEKAREEAIRSYEKSLKKLVIRTEPIGFDRNHNAVYYFNHNPESLFIEKNGIQGGEAAKSWHIIDNEVLFEEFVSSLDIRGIREFKLHEKIAGDGGGENIKRLLCNNKKTALMAARQREEEMLNRRLNNAMIACASEEVAATGRRSSRLKTGAKEELYAIEEEIRISAEFFKEELTKLEEEEFNYYSLTGIGLLEEFESNSKVKTQCSRLWIQEGDKIQSGIVGLVVSNILQLESFCENLSPYEDTSSRDVWKENFEELEHKWNESCAYDLGPNTKSTRGSPSKKKQRKSYDSTGSSVIISALKGTLVELEARVHAITGQAKAVREVDVASENISIVSDGTQVEESEDLKATKRKEKTKALWMDKIYSLELIATKRAALIRDVIISAIAIARKGDLHDAVEDLQSALKMHRPGAGGQAKTQALSLIDKYGGYDPQNLEESSIVNGDMDFEVSEPEDSPSCLCADAMVLTGCLEGHDDADRMDWKDSVMECRKITRIAALSTALKTIAMPKLQKVAKDKKNLSKAIEYWDASFKTRKSRSSKKKKERFDSASEVWAPTDITTQTFIMAKVEGYPWWPARVCDIKDSEVADSLKRLDKEMISFIGEEHLHVVDSHGEIRSFSGEIEAEDDLSVYSTDVVKKLKKSVDMATRFLRGVGHGSAERMDIDFVEEKKTST